MLQIPMEFRIENRDIWQYWHKKKVPCSIHKSCLWISFLICEVDRFFIHNFQRLTQRYYSSMEYHLRTTNISQDQGHFLGELRHVASLAPNTIIFYLVHTFRLANILKIGKRQICGEPSNQKLVLSWGIRQNFLFSLSILKPNECVEVENNFFK